MPQLRGPPQAGALGLGLRGGPSGLAWPLSSSARLGHGMGGGWGRGIKLLLHRVSVKKRNGTTKRGSPATSVETTLGNSVPNASE